MIASGGIRPWSVVRHILLLTGALVMLAPFIWMVSTASKPQTEIFSSDLHLIPYSFALWDNLRVAFAKANLWRFLLNGLIVTVAIFALQVLIALPAAYALAKLRFLGRDALFALVVFCILIPPQATAIPAVTAFGIFSVVAHWNDYFWPLIVLNSEHLRTPPLAVAHFRNAEAGTNYGPLMAAAIVIIAPLVIAFLFAQRRFIEGITFTSVK